MISAITLVCLGCLFASWLVFERPLGVRNSKIESRNSKLVHQPFLTPSSGARGVTEASVTAPAPLVQDSGSSAANRRRVVEGYGRMPLSFEANAGQTDARVKFLARGPGYTLFLTGDEAVLALKKAESRMQKVEARPSKLEIRNATIGDRQSATGNRQSTIEVATPIPGSLIPSLETAMTDSRSLAPRPQSPAPSVLRMKLLGANPAAKVSGAEELPGKANCFIGNDPRKWRTNVPTYARVSYKNVYRGVDLVYYGNQRQLEYDFVVAPGADPSAIALDVAAGLPRHPARENGGLKPPLQIAADGDLVIPTEGGELRFRKPVVYQEQESGFGIQDSGAAHEARDSASGARHSSLVTSWRAASSSTPRIASTSPWVLTITPDPW
jgi:hypothetical protein